MKLTEPDYKLLSYLYHNPREPRSKIAERCNLSRDQVDYKIKKFVDSGLIKSFVTFFDYAQLGYNTLVILFAKLKTPKGWKGLVESLEKSERCISYGRVFGKYDLFANCIFRDESELGNYLAELSGENLISDYLVLKPYFSELYPAKFFNHMGSESFVLTSSRAKGKLDKKEIEIIKILSRDARARVIDIAGKLGISAELVVYKMKKLKKDRLIVGSRIQFDMEKLGYFFSAIMIDFKDFSLEKQKAMKRFAKSFDYVHSVNFQISKPNCVLQIFHKDELELRQTVEAIRRKFGDSEIGLEVLPIGEDERLADTLPFIK